MGTSNLLYDLLPRMIGPMILIGSDHRVRYVSPAFTSLTGASSDAIPCDALLVTANSINNKDCCCWDVLDAYLAEGGPAYWQLKDGNGGCRPVQCGIRPVVVTDQPVLIGIEMKLMDTHVSQTALSFFRCLRWSAVDLGGYRDNVADYLRTHCDFGYADWLTRDGSTVRGLGNPLKEGLTRVIDGVDPAVRRNGIFDVLLEVSGRPQIFHVFGPPNRKGRAWLVVGKMRGQVGGEIISMLQAAVAVDNESLKRSSALADLSVHATLGLLTVAEREVLGLIREGRSDKEIAGRRGVSVNTVRNQVRTLMRKTGVHKRTRLVALSLSDTHGD